MMMGIIYDMYRERVDSERIAVKAVLDPMLMRPSRPMTTPTSTIVRIGIL